MMKKILLGLALCIVINSFAFAAPQNNVVSFTYNITPAMGQQTFYQMKFILSNSSGISGYYAPDNIIYTNGTTRPDWFDVNATDGSNNARPFWVENGTYTTHNATAWVNVSTIAVDNSSTGKWWFGNSGQTTSTANINNTFILGDDFNTAAVDTAKWGVTGASITQLNSIITVTGSSGDQIVSVNTYGNNFSYRTYSKITGLTDDGTSILGYHPASGNGAAMYMYRFPTASTNNALSQSDAGANTGTDVGAIDSNYHVYDISHIPTKNVYTVDSVTKATHTTNVFVTAKPVKLRVEGLATRPTIYSDWIVLRKRVDIEPITSGYTASFSGASFTSNVSSGLANLPIQFNDTSIGSPSTWNWTFGDGGTSTLQNPTHTFGYPGPFAVSLNTSFGDGTFSTASSSITTTLLQYNSTNWYTDMGLKYGTFRENYYYVTESSLTNPSGHVYKYASDNLTLIAVNNTLGNHTWGESYTPVVHGDYVFVSGYAGTPPYERFVDTFHKSNMSYYTTLRLPSLGQPYYDPILDKMLFFGCWESGTNTSSWFFYSVNASDVFNVSAYEKIDVDTNRFPSFVAGATSVDPHIRVWNNTYWYFVETGGGPSYPWELDVYKSTDLRTWTWQWNASSAVNSTYGFTQWANNDRYLALGYASAGKAHIKWTSSGDAWSDYDTGIVSPINKEDHPLLWFTANNIDTAIFSSSSRASTTSSQIYAFNVSNSSMIFQTKLPNATTTQTGYTDQQQSLERDPNGAIFISYLMIADAYHSEIIKFDTGSFLQGSPVPLSTSFTASNTTPPKSEAIQFTDSSTNVTAILDYYWMFGDGNTSYVKNPTYAYPSNGVYSVNHSITTADGTEWYNQSNYITVGGGGLIANFVASSNPSGVGTAVVLTDTSSGVPTTWNWTIDGSVTNTTQNAAYVFSTVGTHTIDLNVTNSTGSFSNLTKTQTVANASGFNQQDIFMVPHFVVTLHITDSTNAPIPVVTVTDSHGQSYTTTNGTAYFTEDAGVTVFYFASTGYASKAMSYVVDEDATHTVQLVTSSSSAPVYNVYPPKDVKFHITSFFGAPIPNANVTIQGITTSTGNWDWVVTLIGISLDEVAINGTAMTETTDSNGDAVFLMLPSVKYNITTTASGYTFPTSIIAPQATEYTLIANWNESWFSSGNDTLKDVNVSVSWVKFNETHSFVNITYDDQTATTTGGTITVYRDTTGRLANATPIKTMDITGTSCSNSTLVDTPTGGSSYRVQVNATTTDQNILRTFTHYFKGSPVMLPGFTTETILWLALFIIIFTAAFAGATHSPQMAVVLCVESWVFWAIGWLDYLISWFGYGEVSVIGVLTLASFITVLWNITEGKAKGKRSS